MPKAAHLTVELEPELREALAAEAKAAGSSPAQLVHDLIDGFVRRQRDTREHDTWFREEVARALRDADDPTVARIPDEDVRVGWRIQRAELLRRINGERGED